MSSFLILHTLLAVGISALFLRRSYGLTAFSPLVWYLVFHNLVFVVRPLFVEYMSFQFVYDYIGFTPDASEKIRALLIADTGLIALVLGHHLYWRTRGTAMARGWYEHLDSRRVPTEADRQGIFVMSLLLLPLALYSAYATLDGFSFDGSTNVQVEWVDGVLVNVNTSGYFTELKSSLATILLLLLIATRFNKIVVAIVLLYIAYRLFLGWQRIFVVAFAAQILLYSCHVQLRKWPHAKFVVLAIAILPLFVYLGENRDAIRAFVTGTVTTPTQNTPPRNSHPFDSLDFASYEYLIFIGAVVPDRTGTYSYGLQYLQLFTEPIPRTLWPGKPVGAPIKTVDLNQFGNFLGLTRSLPGDGWINGGYIGVLFTLGVGGFILCALYVHAYLQGSFWTQIAWIASIPYSVQLFRDGGIVSISRFLLFALLPIILAAAISKVLAGRRKYAH